MNTEKGFFAKIADTISSELEYNRRTAEELGVERLDLFLHGTKGAVKRKRQKQISEVLDALEDLFGGGR